MTLAATPHLNFRGDARTALEFYQSVFGGQLTIITYANMGNVQDPSEANQVVWGQVEAPDGFRVMAYDVPAARLWSRGDDPFFLSLRGTDAEEIQARWENLSDGASIAVPLSPAQWSPLYGMLRDRFGITWVVDVAVAYHPS